MPTTAHVTYDMPENNNPQHNTLGVTVKELQSLGFEHLPQQFVSGEHLIYSSPASLSFNSPGAEGFGVKRAALSIPGSVLLLISPGCCGRNTSGISELPQYKNRFFFLNMDESDIVTGRHLKKVPDAVEAVISEYELRTGTKPSVVMICITCVDALLGTDMERVCRKAEAKVKLPVRPCYMYALTREGRKPPMVHVRQSLYSLLEARKKRAASINLLGHFAPLIDDCELYNIFRNMGVKQIREISRCRDYAEFQLMAEANFNVVLDAEARPAAAELEERLGIPYIELKRLYQIDKVKRQYEALAKALNTDINIDESFNTARLAIDDFKAQFAGVPAPSFAVGEFMNGDPFELALALVREGFRVPEVFGTISRDNFLYIEKLAELSPETYVYSNLDPGIIHYNENAAPCIDFAIGKDAAYYHPHAVSLHWKDDIQPFGFAGIRKLYCELLETYKTQKASRSSVELEKAVTSSVNISVQAKPEAAAVFGCDTDTDIADSVDTVVKPSSHVPPCNTDDVLSKTCMNASDTEAAKSFSDCPEANKHRIRGLRRFLPPFAPDASGASSVLYSLGGITVICDAGGCAGNICGFDEPRWLTEKSAIYSAGLRDMDAILGRDDRLVEKLKRTVNSVGAENVSFAAIIGTPVPSVIATDYQALKRMCERRTGVRTLCVDTNGMELYDVGAEKAYMELFRSYLDNASDRTICHNAVNFAKPESKNNTGCGFTASDNTASDNTALDNIASDNIASDNTASDNTALDNTALDNIASKDLTACESFASPEESKDYTGYIGILGATPLDTGTNKVKGFFSQALGTDKLCCFCLGDGIDAISQAGAMSKNIVAAPSALKLAKYLEQKFGTPYEVSYPGADMLLAAANNFDIHFNKKRVLIIHQHVLALSLAKLIEAYGAVNVTTASWFKLIPDCDGIALHDEDDLTKLLTELQPDIIISDNIIEPLVRDAGCDALIIDLPHFAVSGRMLSCACESTLVRSNP